MNELFFNMQEKQCRRSAYLSCWKLVASFIFDKNKRETNEIEETSTPSPNKGMALPEVMFRVVGEREHLL